MTNFFALNENNFADPPAWLRTSCKALVYISETDAPIVPFLLPKQEGSAEPPAGDPETAVSEIPFDMFFAPLIEDRDWYGEREKEIAKRFAELKKLLEENLRDLKVVRIGTIQIDIYVTGTDPEGNTAGFKTKAVET